MKTYADSAEMLVRDFPVRREPSDQGELVRGLAVRLSVSRAEASAEIQLGDDARFFPTDAALASWTAQAASGRAEIVYE